MGGRGLALSRAGAHLSRRLSALQSRWLCSVSHTSLVSVTGPLLLGSALTLIVQVSAQTPLERDLSWYSPASITLISFAHLL